jgi:hypothetical protein
MKVQEVEARIEAQIMNLEDEESRLQEWLDCLRKLDGIAAEWNVDLREKRETEEASMRVEEGEVVSQGEAVAEAAVTVSDESLRAEPQERMAKDPIEQLRRKLVGEPEEKSKPVFRSGLLFGANA